MDLDEVLAATFTLVAPHLTERQRRLLLGAAARALGYGGVSRVARLAEASRPTVRRGAAELDQPADPRGRIRQHEGPKRRRDTDPGLLAALDRLVEPDTRGDPESPLRWTCKSTRELAATLTAQGHPVSDDTVGRLLNMANRENAGALAVHETTYFARYGRWRAGKRRSAQRSARYHLQQRGQRLEPRHPHHSGFISASLLQAGSWLVGGCTSFSGWSSDIAAPGSTRRHRCDLAGERRPVRLPPATGVSGSKPSLRSWQRVTPAA